MKNYTQKEKGLRDFLSDNINLAISINTKTEIIYNSLKSNRAYEDKFELSICMNSKSKYIDIEIIPDVIMYNNWTNDIFNLLTGQENQIPKYEGILKIKFKVTDLNQFFEIVRNVVREKSINKIFKEEISNNTF